MQSSYDQLCKNKQLAFTIFSKVKDPFPLIEQSDIAEFELAKQEQRSRFQTTFYSSLLSTCIFCLILKMRNPIYALTARYISFYKIRSSFYGLLKKYYIVPIFLSQPFYNQYSQLYDEKVNKILKKYDFTTLQFQQAFKQIEADGGIQKFMKKHLSEKDEEPQESVQQTQL
ncbi:unnamed protein product (macronuclear) [Paramecium tetraurelia]|uniref:Transmembrane protein n=1 Tax=Paramecium tetraurelia TaxID=5888 RepID=A0BUZ6_PARTE|nr:uncharacterized protein GSPATT00005609001 [Paramecium tetraurelia]CAK62363.1 unnamed protein product [Paramecium tetraurelia]|eukprot:XP_001429761.1 hypothetical protein (macronuclear) [Paramecium tetraurelia strain d4-2]